MTKPTYGYTKTGVPVDEHLIAQLADEAGVGYDVDAVLARRGKRGRPTLGTSPSTVESVRLDAELKAQVARRAEVDGVGVSDVIREALRQYLQAS
jgi:uncharacterized protein (DUF4415 family)